MSLLCFYIQYEADFDEYGSDTESSITECVETEERENEIYERLLQEADDEFQRLELIKGNESMVIKRKRSETEEQQRGSKIPRITDFFTQATQSG